MVLVFKHTGHVHAGYLHADGCKALNRANPRRGFSVISGRDVADAVEDLEDRQYKVHRCKCLFSAGA